MDRIWIPGKRVRLIQVSKWNSSSLLANRLVEQNSAFYRRRREEKEEMSWGRSREKEYLWRGIPWRRVYFQTRFDNWTNRFYIWGMRRRRRIVKCWITRGSMMKGDERMAIIHRFALPGNEGKGSLISFTYTGSSSLFLSLWIFK